jgi:ubiquinone/menaquinone biosynthesis C-methylase UbiE
VIDVSEERQYWANRSTHYAKLEWAARSDYLNAVVQAAHLKPTDIVIDAGTGTGLIANAAAPFVESVVGLDHSPEMLAQARAELRPNQTITEGNITDLPFGDGTFTKGFARMVFHGLTGDAPKAAKECFRVLKPGGQFILSEGVPPDRLAADWYTEMFKLKEERLTIFPEDLENLMSSSGFKDIITIIHVTPQVSIKNWLDNSGLPKERQNLIMQRHFDMPRDVWEVYNATAKENDVLLDMKFAITLGFRP